MAFVKRTWLARIGTGLNKFIIGEKDANDKQTLVNSPDSVTQQGDVISAENFNDLEERIETAVNANETAINANATKIAGMKLTKIWGNSRPLASFPSQTITINNLVCEEVVIEYAPNILDDYLLWSCFKQVKTFSSSTDFTSFLIEPYSLNQGEFVFFHRSFSFYNSSQNTYLQFGNGGYGTTTDNSKMIPLAIYAVGDIYNTEE